MRNYRNLALVLSSPVLVLGFVATSRNSGPSKNRIGATNWFSPQSASRNLSLYLSTNPFTSMIGDVASSIFGGIPKVAANRKVEATLAAMSTASWTELRDKLESQQTPEEKSFRQNLAKGYGVPSPLHKVRLYDESNREEDIAVTFYRDSASWCVSCTMMLSQIRIRYFYFVNLT
jgi:hypothetical protein